MTQNDEQKKLPHEEIVSISDRQVEEKIKDFGNLLQAIENVDDKRKQLWQEIYENAITDRQNSFIMFKQLSKICGDKSTEYAVHARSLATFIEKMSKANDQLIRLAELISRTVTTQEEPEEDPTDPEKLFSQIKNN